jgi:hypothetical protein
LGIGGRAATLSGIPYIFLNASAKRVLRKEYSVKAEAPHKDGTE